MSFQLHLVLVRENEEVIITNVLQLLSADYLTLPVAIYNSSFIKPRQYI
jgi:hypothetical protein